ncbi:MAG: peptide-methionine (S)-S-oxide reductase MsrA [Planctomycetota bacterium]|nr:peptide-methionine (S)-S-oxide reductase MsrA [Planctomycetota bacterium]
MEDRFAALDGVVDVVSGYMGGHLDHPTYEQVCSGQTGHAETVEIHYHPDQIRYSDLVKRFFALHDSTTPDQQGANVGSQYRSVVFCNDSKEEQQVQQQIDRLAEEGLLKGRSCCTQVISPLPKFWRAEEYHQHYYQKHRGFISR